MVTLGEGYVRGVGEGDPGGRIFVSPIRVQNKARVDCS